MKQFLLLVVLLEVVLLTLAACAAPTLPPISAPTEVSPPTAEATAPPTVDRVQIYLIALEDAGKSGPAVGCGDSAIAVEVPVEPTAAPLQAAFTALLSIKEQFYGQSGLYNALYQSDLHVEQATVENGVATVYLAGTMMLGGECDNPRVEAQLLQTALQFPDVSEAHIFVNGASLEEALSLK